MHNNSDGGPAFPIKPRDILSAWQELCAAENACFGDSLTFNTVEPILRKLVLAHADRLKDLRAAKSPAETQAKHLAEWAAQVKSDGR